MKLLDYFDVIEGPETGVGSFESSKHFIPFAVPKFNAPKEIHYAIGEISTSADVILDRYTYHIIYQLLSLMNDFPDYQADEILYYLIHLTPDWVIRKWAYESFMADDYLNFILENYPTNKNYQEFLLSAYALFADDIVNVAYPVFKDLEKNLEV